MGVSDLRDLSVFFISYDEPNADANWQRLSELAPDAIRVHGVLGFDAAHKTCARASATSRFVTVDGDNWVEDGALSTEIDDTNMEDACFSFKSRNIINGLEYGNGGIKIWHRETMLASNTHERSDTTDFCWDMRYYQVDSVASTTVQNCTPYQAWRAGYREGIKMSYINGKPLVDFSKQWSQIWRGNLSRLTIWASVGRDVDNGTWAMLGARSAMADMVRRRVRHTDINDYDWFSAKWSTVMNSNPEHAARELGSMLRDSCGFPIPELDADASRWFKMVYTNPKREGFML